jgi:hypothetical protein
MARRVSEGIGDVAQTDGAREVIFDVRNHSLHERWIMVFAFDLKDGPMHGRRTSLSMGASGEVMV